MDKISPEIINSVLAKVRPRDSSLWDDDLQIVNERDHIVDNLWLGGWPSSGVDQFKYVFCLAANPNYFATKGKSIITWAPFDDVDALPPVEFLHEIADQVVAASKKGPTLVHCAAGVNRSGLIMALALVKLDWEPHVAIAHLRNKRSQSVLFNTTFEQYVLTQ